MKKSLLVLTLCMVSVAMFSEESLPGWAHELYNKNTGFIDSILLYRQDPKGPDTRTYVIYYHQPLVHSQPEGQQFPLRALMTVHNDTDPTTAINHIYCSGYEIMSSFLNRPDSVFAANKKYCATEIAHRYKANFIQIEHRYFSYSAPRYCWTNLDPLTAEEAAADFHNLFEALKKVLKGKYVMSGVSKGGITTLLQHAFYPDDMDIYVPYSAPFFSSDRDLDLQKYWYTHGLNKEYRDMFMSIRRQAIAHSPDYFDIYENMNYNGNNSKERRDTLYGQFMAHILEFGSYEHTYSDTSEIRKMIYANDSILKAVGYNEGYTDTVYAYMVLTETFSLEKFQPWLDTLRKYSGKEQMPARVMPQHQRNHNPFGVEYNDWWEIPGDTTTCVGYNYQSKRELGYYDGRFDLIIEDKATADEWNKHWVENYGCLRDVYSPVFSSLSFSRNLYDDTMDKTRNTTKPIVLIYGYDDTWTGAAVKDEFINGTNVRKFILPAQNHLVSFSSDTDIDQCNEIRSLLDGILGEPQKLEQTTIETSAERARKIMIDGQLYIILGKRVYNAAGQQVDRIH